MNEDWNKAFERIRQRVEHRDGCWLWRGSATKDGYGQIRVGRAVRVVHRVAYTAANGPIPRGMVVRHKCDVRLCCNPDHLEIGTHEDNAQDIVDRGRLKNRRSLTPAEKAIAKRMRADGQTIRAIAVALACNWHLAREASGKSSGESGRPRGSRNTYVRVTDEHKSEIRRRYLAGGVTQQQLAEEFGIDQTYVSIIVREVPNE